MKKYILFISVLIGLISCKKDKATVYPDKRIPVPQILADYGYFKKGTYWIYRDTATLALDSVYVTASKQGTEQNTPDNGHPYNGYYGYFNVYTQSSFEGVQYNDWVDTHFTSGGHSEIWRNKINNAGTPSWLMTDYFVVGQTFVPDNGYASTVAFENQYDSLKIESNYFKNVVLFNDKQNPIQYNSVTNVYLAKNIGVIRKEILATHKVWNLIRYNVVQ
ncbi:MAG TPA: hypothetical protein VGO45_14415 [Bacteroidia bacterium]|jgi:hypothetical protein|nr:hypothetical protein [Bacteroidia bacterium]